MKSELNWKEKTMKRLAAGLAMVLVAAGLLVFATGYTRDISGDLRRDTATGVQACLVALEALIAGEVEAPAETITWFDKPVATPDTSVPLAAAAANVRAVWMVAKRTDAANAGTVYIKDSTVDKDNKQGVALAPGDYFEIPIPAGTTIDLHTVYVDADTATDGVCGGYITE